MLQVLLASHPRIRSFPETGFLVRAVGSWRRPIAWLGLASGKEHQAIKILLERIGREDLITGFPQRTRCFQAVMDGYVGILDQLALEEGRDIWLEKTPRHFDYISLIRKYVQRVHFIHMIRDGRDVVASIYDRALTFPDKFGGQRDLTAAIQLWNHALRVSLKYLGTPGHTFVIYEQLVRHVDTELARVCNDIGVVYDPSKTEEVDRVAQRVVLPSREWLRNATEPPRVMPSKFEQLFDQETRRWITENLELGRFEKIKKMTT